MKAKKSGLRSSGSAFGAAVLGFSLVGCVTETISTMYANEFNCPEDKVVVDDIGGQRYRARGCDRVVMYHCFSARDCIPTNGTSQEPKPRAKPSREREPVSAVRETELEAHVEKNSSDQNVVALDVPLDARTMLKLRALTGEAETVQLKIVRMEAGDALDDCDAAVLINGARTNLPPGKFFQEKGTNGILISVAPTMIRELALAHKFAVRVCDSHWSLSENMTEEVRHFADLYQQEQAWAAPTSGGGTVTNGLVAPADGWPPWKPIAILAADQTGNGLEGPALFKQLSPSVYKVVVSVAGATQQGSAVAISSNQLLTNCHVLESAQKISLQQGKKILPATIWASDPALDRCVLNVTGAPLVPVRGFREQSSLQVGEPLYTLGSPSGLELTLSNGILSGVREEDGRTYVQTSAPISPGSSGGGLFDAHGNLVGITTSVLVGRERLNQSLNFAIPAEVFGKP